MFYKLEDEYTTVFRRTLFLYIFSLQDLELLDLVPTLVHHVLNTRQVYLLKFGEQTRLVMNTYINVLFCNDLMDLRDANHDIRSLLLVMPQFFGVVDCH